MKVVIYARFSPRPDEDLCNSCEVQIRDCEAWCKLKGHEVQGVYRDDAMSGADDGRPGLREAIDSLRRRWAVVVRSIDRLSRDNWMTEVYRREIAMKGGFLLTVDGISVADESAEQEFIRIVFQGHAQYQRRKIRETTKKKMAAHQADGRRMSGVLPFGWRLDPSSPLHPRSGQPTGMIHDPDEQSAISLMLELSEGGAGVRTIAHRLNDEGHTCRGHAWCHSTVHKILRRVRKEKKSPAGAN